MESTSVHCFSIFSMWLISRTSRNPNLRSYGPWAPTLTPALDINLSSLLTLRCNCHWWFSKSTHTHMHTHAGMWKKKGTKNSCHTMNVWKLFKDDSHKYLLIWDTLFIKIFYYAKGHFVCTKIHGNWINRWLKMKIKGEMNIK